MVITLICILFLLILLFAVKAATTAGAFKKRFEESDRMIVELQNRVDALEMQAGIAQSDCQRLTRQLLDLTNRMADVTAAGRRRAASDREGAVKPVAGYFDNAVNSDNPYFRQLLGSRGNDTKFAVTATDDPEVVTFEPTDMAALLSSGGSDSVLLITGDVTAGEASSYGVSKPGFARHDGERWIVVSPCQIYFIR